MQSDLPVSKVRVRENERLVDQEFISLLEIAKRWSVSRNIVRRALERAGVRPFYIGDSRNSTLRYAVEDVERFMRSCRVQEH